MLSQTAGASRGEQLAGQAVPAALDGGVLPMLSFKKEIRNKQWRKIFVNSV